MKIGVTSCPQYRSKIIGKGQKPVSRRSNLLWRPFIMKAMNPSGCRGRRRQGLVSSAIIPTERFPSITVPSATARFSRSQECLSESICFIVLKNILASAPNISPLGTDWEGLREVRPKLRNSIRSPKKTVEISEGSQEA